MKSYIKGNFKKFIFNGQNGYVIGLFKVKETNNDEINIYIDRTITFTGYFSNLNEMDTYIFYGSLVEHEKYGEQFNVEKYERVLLEEKDSIITFLSSDLFSGIGEKKAAKIVSVLGKDTLKIILENKDNLLLIPTVTKKNVEELHNKLLEYENSYKTVISLTELGFSTRDSLIIYNKYKEKTLDTINDNIYNLYEDIRELSFKKIDYIALKQNMDRLDIRRINAMILYIIEEVCNIKGNSYLSKEEIYFYLRKMVNIDENLFNKSINQLLIDIKLINREDKYYIKSMYEAERNIVYRLLHLKEKTENKSKKIDKLISDIEKVNNITYNEEQKKSIKNAIEKNILIITGGPGTGKTTIIKAICEVYKNKNKLTTNELTKELVLLAPTGRASKRLTESTNLPSYTIHRFLKWNKETNKFQVNEHNKSDVKFIIVDESSMLDTYLFDSLLKGIFFDTKIVLVGDDNQLPSVGPGQVLKDLIDSEVIDVNKLNVLYRQKENSNIITLAYDIRNGIFDDSIFNKNIDLTFIPCDQTKVKDNIKKIIKNNMNIDYKNIQLLAPMYKTINGIDELNVLLQNIYNKKAKEKKEIIVNGVIYRENDKVMQLTNMPDDNVFNGDIGIITKIELSPKKEIHVSYDNNIVKYNSNTFNKITHGYAISIHKSQGSEFDVVIIPISKLYNKMLYRKLIYTAVTRAKKKLYLVGELDALNISINNNVDNRKTTIKDRLINNNE